MTKRPYLREVDRPAPGGSGGISPESAGINPGGVVDSIAFA